jgi:hypothetical protein
MKKAAGVKARLGKKSVSKSRSKLVEIAALSAAGITFGRDALAAGTPESGLIDESADVAIDEAQVDASSELASDDVRSEADDSELALEAEGADQLALLADGEAVQYADASDVLGVRSGESVQYAQASTGSSAAATKTGAAKDAGASTAGAADVAADVAASAGAGAVGTEAVVAVGIGAVALGALGAVGAGAGAAAGGGAGAGFAAKGILSGSTVFYDFDGDGKLSAGDASATTSATGTYSINLTKVQKTQVESGKDANGKALKIVVTGGTDVTNGVGGTPFTGTLTSLAPTDLAVEGKVNIFSTMKGAGMSNVQLTELLGRDVDSLTDDDFDQSGDGAEAIALKLYALVSAKLDALGAAGDDADISDAAFAAVGKALEELSEGAVNLNTMLAGMSSADMLVAFGTMIDKGIELAQSGLSESEIDQVLGAYADSLDTAGVFTALEDGDVTNDGLNFYANAEADAEADADVVEGQVTNVANDGAMNLASTYGANVHFDGGGLVDGYVLDETDVETLIAQRVSDPFGANAGADAHDVTLEVEGTLLADSSHRVSDLHMLGVDSLSVVSSEVPGLGGVATIMNATNIYLTEADAQYAIDHNLTDLLGGTGINVILQVEGTLLGTAANPLTFDQLSKLGVDGIRGDDAAGYLHLTADNFTNITVDNAFFADVGDISGTADPIFVDGTIYSNNQNDSDLNNQYNLDSLSVSNVQDIGVGPGNNLEDYLGLSN